MSQRWALPRCHPACRSVIEATAKEKGITTGNLKNKIEEMENQRLIRPHIKAVADGIRDYGNEMAHGDFATPVGPRTRR